MRTKTIYRTTTSIDRLEPLLSVARLYEQINVEPVLSELRLILTSIVHI